MTQPVAGWSVTTANDRPALRRFYSKLSGSSISDAEDGSGYGLVQADEKGIGAMIGASHHGAQRGVNSYVAADDPTAVLDKAETLEGKTILPPAEIAIGLTRGAVQ